ncbi:hypothetical protein DRP05_10615 [Archaeoglobales archaeon]|nr:MAG: hypothetical protein DRO97_06345 [Archaeoglobales archaeon]RLI77300.1 MAG: hypothetical protein DRP05_10615 [Archaeoglobales archaeon]
MPAVKLLPWDKNLGYPQWQRAIIGGKAYTLHYRWNKYGFPVLKIVRDEDSAIVFNEKLVKDNPREAKDPDTYEVLFTILPRKIEKTDTEIWLFEG